MILFERVIELTIGDTNIVGLDIAFEIEKDLTPEPNFCEIEIFNLNPENRATLSKYDKVPVLLKAGYKDSVGLIFKGDMLICQHLKEESSWKTVLMSGDGVKAIHSARTKKSYANGTPVKTVVKDLAEALGLSHGGAINQMNELNTQLNRGFMVSGNPMAELNRILHGQMSISVQNGEVQMLKKGESLQKEAIMLASDSGLLASPEMGSKGEIIIKTVILPELAPGRKVFIDSSYLTGFATIQSVRFKGANFGDAWESEIVVLKG